MAKAIWGSIFATYLLGFMSCGHYVVDQIEVSWDDDIERDKRELMLPIKKSNKEPTHRNYDVWAPSYELD